MLTRRTLFRNTLGAAMLAVGVRLGNARHAEVVQDDEAGWVRVWWPSAIRPGTYKPGFWDGQNVRVIVWGQWGTAPGISLSDCLTAPPNHEGA